MSENISEAFSILPYGTRPQLGDPVSLARRIAAAKNLWSGESLIDALAVVMPRDEASDFVKLLTVRGDVVVLSGGSGNECILPARSLRLRIGDQEAVSGLLLEASAETVSLEDGLGLPEWRALSDAPDLAALAAEPAKDDVKLEGWRFIGQRGDPRSLISWPKDAPCSPPRQVERLIALFGENVDSFDLISLGELSDWAGLPDGTVDTGDPSQRAVAYLPMDMRVVVTAGPGAGKTHTIRARLGELEAQGVSAARTLCIVYSRAAARALSERCADLPGGARPQIRTLDSLAAELTGTVSGDHDATVLASTQALDNPDSEAVAYIAGREHVILDEAQDVVGPRRAFLLALIAALDPECGVTVLGDPAQAIYDYSDQGALPLHRVLLDAHGFDQHRLERNHRTPPGPLRDFAFETGHLLREDLDDPEIAVTVRSRIEAVADALDDTRAHDVRSPDLHLFRSGAAMMIMALDLSRSGVPFTARGGISGASYPALGAAWLAPMVQVLCEGATIDEAVSLVRDPVIPSRDTLVALFEPLHRQGGLRIDACVRALETGALPELGPLDGSVALSVIHASKGLEADHVALHLPLNGQDSWTESRPLEEARVLYVAATRARRRLSLQIVRRWMKRSKQGRYWRREGNSAVVALTSLDAPETRLLPTRDAKYFAAGGRISDPHLIWDKELRRWILHDADGPLAALPGSFADAVSEIGRDAFPECLFIPEARGWLHARPATVVQDGKLAVAPVLDGFVRIGFAGGKAS